MRALIFTLFSALTLSACGGSSGGSTASTGPSYTGIIAPVAIDSTVTAETVGTKTAEAASEAIIQNATNESNPFAVSISTQDSGINQILVNIAHSIPASTANLPIAAQTLQYTDLGPDFCGGSVTIDDSFLSSLDSGLLNGSMTLSNLCYTDLTLGNITLNGTIRFSETASNLTIQYLNFSINDGSSTQTINMTLSCDLDVFDCALSSDYKGSDGKVYRLADMSISGAGTGPYYFSATFYHPDFGSVDITTLDPVYFQCSNGHPSSGTLQYTGSNGSIGTITFTDCDNYTGDWNDNIQPTPATDVYTGSWLN